MYETTSVNQSPLEVFKTAAALTSGSYTAVALGENGLAVATSGVPTGLLLDVEGTIPAGEYVTIQVSGGGLWLVSEAVKTGDFLSVGDGGKAVKATSGAYIFAQALDNAAANSAVRVRIVHGGYQA